MSEEIPQEEEYVEESEQKDEDPEVLQRKLAEMEEELAKLKQVQAAQVSLLPGSNNNAAAAGAGAAGGAGAGGAAGAAAVGGPDDGKSIFIGNINPETTAEDLQNHFQACGTVNLVTILVDKFKRPKGFAYLEFAEREGMVNALELNESQLHGRNLKVMPKRVNMPGLGRGRVAARPRFFAPRGAPRGGYYYRPRGRGGRFHPYGNPYGYQ